MRLCEEILLISYVGDNMSSDVQSRKVAKYRKLAGKNTFCKYIAVILLIIDVICAKFFSFHKRRLIVLAELCLVVMIFTFSTSFAPPAFASVSDVELGMDEYAVTFAGEEMSDAASDAALEVVVQDEHDLIDTTEDTANLDDLIEKSKETSVIEEEKEAEEQSQFSKDDWKLLLVNKQHTIPEDYEFTLGTIKGSMRCDERIIEPLTQMFAAAKEDGVNLVVCSPYRDMARQEYLFERKVKGYLRTGMSYMDAYKTASITVTVPGASEHQVGLAVDIFSDTYTSLDEGFADTPAGMWLAEHSWEHGFILRYPLGKEEITGIQYEPWHFRYVGVEAAEIIMKDGITLEEFVENL